MVVIRRLQQAAEGGVDSERLKVLPAYFGTPNRGGGSIRFESEDLVGFPGYRREDAVVIANIANLREGEDGVTRGMGRESEHAIGVRDIQGLEHDGLQYPKHN